MMEKKLLSLLLVITMLSIVNSQSLSQVVIASSGATISNASNTLSFTSGERIIGKITSGSSLGQGFWLGAIEAVVLSTDDFKFEAQTTVYPNPVTDYLTVHFKNMDGEAFTISVYDVTGRQVYEKKLAKSTSDEVINFTEYSSGLYLIIIEQRDTQKTKSFKIIKK